MPASTHPGNLGDVGLLTAGSLTQAVAGHVPITPAQRVLHEAQVCYGLRL